MEKRSENMTKLIELKGINKTYKNGDQELRVLKTRFRSRRGRIYIMGPSSSGKSTLMNVIGLLDRPTSGEYFLEGQEVGNLSEKKISVFEMNRSVLSFNNSFFQAQCLSKCGTASHLCRSSSC